MKDQKTLLMHNNSSDIVERKRVKVLLVDDRKENLFSLEQLLEDDVAEAEFIKCTSGNEALQIALKEELALILLDVQMPGMDGYEVARFLKQNKKTSSIPIIFVTALDHEVNYILEGYKTGAVDYLTKPLNPIITRAKVSGFIKAYAQQKELEQKNIELENLAMLVNNSMDLMCIIDARTMTFKSTNPAWKNVLGYDQSFIMEHSADILPECGNCFSPLLETTEIELLCENKMSSSSGEIMWFSWSFVKKENQWFGNGKNITKNRLIAKQLEIANEVLEKKVQERTADLLSVNKKLTIEIEKRRQAEEGLQKYNTRLLKANEELDSFVYVASHDLKSPISNIESLLTLLQKILTGKLTEDESRLFDHVELSLNKFNATLKDLGRIIAVDEELEVDYTDLYLPSILDDVKTDIQKMILDSSAVIIEELDIKNIRFSRKHLRSILFNLLSNALKYRSMERLPKIEIKTWENEEFVVIQVKDNGMGLKKKHREKLFTMFKRFHAHVEGSGIGLYLIKKIIDNSDGKIEIESTEDVGTNFKIYIKKVTSHVLQVHE